MKRSIIERLPEEVRGELKRKLVANAFSDYEGLAAWLREQGYEIRKSAVHAFGQDFERRIKQIELATQQAKAIVEASPDDEGAMSDALQRLVQDKLFTLLMEIDKVSVDELGPADLARITRAAADIGRASIAQKKWMAEARRKLAEKVEGEIEEIKRAGGLSEEAEARIRKALLE